jgi:hypothetical protein
MNNLKYTTSNEQGELPPGWRTRFSKSKPGKRVYSKCTTQWKRPEVMRIAEAAVRSGNNKQVGGPQSVNPAEVLEAPTQKTYTAERVEEVQNVPKMSKQIEMTGTTCGSLPPNAQEECRRSKGLKGGKGKRGTRRYKNRKGGKRTRRR